MRASRRVAARLRLSPLKLGVAFIVVCLVAGVALFQKNRIITTVQPGHTIAVQFDEAYQLREYVSDAKIAGVPVGVVSEVNRAEDGTTEVTAKIDNDAVHKLGSAPSAAIRPTTMLGGNYYLDLKPGGTENGTFDGTVPAERTETPVELDKVTAALQPGAREGARSSIGDLDGMLRDGGSDALRDLVASAPDTLGPAAEVFDGMRGTRPDRDLSELVTGLESTAHVLSRREGQLDSIVRDLETTSQVLGDRAGDLARSTAGMPDTLDSTSAGLRKLDGTLTKLEKTAEPARPAVRELGTVLENLDPVLVKAQPVINDLRDVLDDSRPLVEDLSPTSIELESTLDNLRSPVLDRVNGPILDTLNSPFEGTGDYEGTGSNRPLYQEVGHMASNVARATMVDENGAMISYMAGVGPGSLAGLPISIEQLFRKLAGQEGVPE
ncbi:phospholipid/cholesterol/gamma-HCH transport system substrate-binding protein [Haloechinothrix alba]|uniref:Phospholipid/cholesterol/gamma-HCH transport system substrate-binding protein n=1 Tax=Haloechinothrix alba TaxID=664784 RepID=A0A238ZNB2_9PSEU|nr:MlaD family protein [Haloechinothrix alba]SNR84153.1 phospholipid/cholesterol/gamma-HCH transport system substrate-binding protein [Haloechinothrix alba]